MRNFVTFFLLAAAWTGNVAAHPVPFKGAIGVMSWNQSFLSDDWVTYSFRHDTAIAARVMRFDATEGRSQFIAPQVDYLLQRWNQADSQANVYLYGGYGALNFQNQTKAAGLAGVQTDAESRKYFASLKYEKMWGSLGPDFCQAEARLGVSPFEAEFNELSGWFMIQYQYHPMLLRKYAITPLVRLFYRSVLFEAGMSTDADFMSNFMFHF